MNPPRPIDYESCAARIRNPTSRRQLDIDRRGWSTTIGSIGSSGSGTIGRSRIEP